MSVREKKRISVRYLCLLALFIAIEVVMKLCGLGSLRITPFLLMSFLTIPIAVGAIHLGPVAGAVLGGVFGLLSLWDAMTGQSGMTVWFFNADPFNTIILCVCMRALMGWVTGLIFAGLKKIDKTKTISYFVGALSAPLLNTLFFMGYIILVFYNTEYVQNLVVEKGVTNPVMFVVALVGVQGLIEAGAGCLIGGTVSKALSKIKGARV